MERANGSALLTSSSSTAAAAATTTTEWKSQDAEMRALFAALDKDKNGYVDKNELRITMLEVGLDLSEKDLDTMMKAAGVVIKDRIFYEDFVKMMTGKIGRSHRKALMMSRDDREPSTYSICEGDEEDPDVQAMRVAFSMFDHDGDGQISVQEVQKTMNTLGIKISLKEVKQIVRRVDTDRDGSISFDEFRQAMTKYQADLKSSAADDVHPVIRQQELTDAFQIFDKDHDGFLNAHDLRSTMQQLGLVLTEDDIHAMMKSAGIGRNGKISYSDFCRIYVSKMAVDVKKHNDRRSNNKLSRRQETELRAVFAIFDMDRDGFITIDEVMQVLVSMGFSPSLDCIQDVFHQVDLDGNGKIDFVEFLLLVKRYERPLPEDIEMREMFNTLDKDKNGFVDPDELKSSFAELGMSLTDVDVQIMMDEAGVHGNRIYYRDFIQIMSGKVGPYTTQNMSFDSEFGFANVVENNEITSQEKLKTKVLTRQHAHVDVEALPPEISSSNVKVETITEVPSVPSSTETKDDNDDDDDDDDKESDLISVGKKKESSLWTNHNTKSFEVQEFFRESVVPECTPAFLANYFQPQKPVPVSSHAHALVPTSTSTLTTTAKPAAAAFDKESSSHYSPPNTWIAFKVFDRNSDGYISKRELHQTMTDLGIELSREDLEVMMEEADINKDGKIDYAEFSKLMGGSFETFAKQAAQLHEKKMKSSSRVPPPPPPSPLQPSSTTISNPTPSHSNGTISSGMKHNSTQNVNAAATNQPPRLVLDSRLGSAEEQMRTAFRVFDIDGNGLIDADELRQTMQHLGEKLTDSDVEAMIKAVDRNMDGKIDYEEFIQMIQYSK